jgi:uncharacterized protein
MTKLAEPSVTLAPLPAGMKHRFHAMVKPIGSLCNLDCTYCYYLHKVVPQHRDPALVPMVGTPQTKAGRAGLGGDRLVGGSG